MRGAVCHNFATGSLEVEAPPPPPPRWARRRGSPRAAARARRAPCVGRRSPSTVSSLTRRGGQAVPVVPPVALLHDFAPHGTGLFRQPLGRGSSRLAATAEAPRRTLLGARESEAAQACERRQRADIRMPMVYSLWDRCSHNFISIHQYSKTYANLTERRCTHRGSRCFLGPRRLLVANNKAVLTE